MEVLLRPLAVLRRGLMSPMGLPGVAAAWAADGMALGRLARSRGVALVHSNTSVTLGGAAAASVARVPHVWHVREIFAGFDRLWPAYRRLLETADALPCVSGAVRLQLGPTARALVLHDGLPYEPARRTRAQARAALGLAPERFVVAVAGRISHWKGQDVLARALAEPALRARGAIGLVAGAPWPGAPERGRALDALADELGVSDRLLRLGFRDDVETIYGAADVIAVPSTGPDPLPNVALEAAAAGCCVVGSAHGGLPEIVADRVSGRLVAPGDARALAATLDELADDPAQRERLGAAAAADVRARFDPQQMLDAVQSLYDRLA